jgi:hypothetical protein
MTSVRPVLDSIVVHWPNGASGPGDRRHFGVLVWLFIGTADGGGVDRFDAFACTPSWIVEAYAPSAPGGARSWLSGSSEVLNGVVVMPEWSESEFRSVIAKLCEECTGFSWRAVGNRLSRAVLWEYDYRYDEEEDGRE